MEQYLYVELARYYQLRSTRYPNAQGALPELSELKIHTLYVKDLPLQEPALPLGMASEDMQLAAVAMPRYVSRTGWGNPDGERAPNAPPRYRTATHLVIHHTADSTSLGRHPN